MEGRRRKAVGSLLGATILLGTFGRWAPRSPRVRPRAPATTPGRRRRRRRRRSIARRTSPIRRAAKAAASAAAAAADPGNVDKAATAAADAADCRRRARRTPTRRPKSLAGVNGGIASDAGNRRR